MKVHAGSDCVKHYWYQERFVHIGYCSYVKYVNIIIFTILE